jgi:hypothetical protein
MSAGGRGKIKAMAKFEITWEAPEFEYRDKGVSWYWLSIIIAAIIVAFSVWTRNFLFGFFIIIAEMLFIVWGNKAPRTITFKMNDVNVEIDEHKIYPLKEFESWSADASGGEWIEMLFNFRSRLKTPLRILVPETKLEEVRANLKAILKEVEYQQTLLDSIEKLLRF